MAADLKMYCIFSQEAIDKMQENRGKMCAQAGHAFLHAWWDCKDKVNDYNISDQDWYDINDGLEDYKRGNDARKITLIVPTDDDLRNLVDKYKSITGTTLVEDCGYTIFTEPTITCAGIGPLYDKDKGDDLRSLPLFC